MTTVAVPDGGTRLRVHARACAALGAAGALGHLWLAPGHGWVLGVGMVAMAAICLPCALGLWRRTGVRAAQTMMGAALAMAVLHAVLLLGGGGSAHSGHSAAAAAAAGVVTGSVSGSVTGGHGLQGMLALTALELVAAFTAATLLSRLRRAGGPAGTAC